MSCIVNSAPLRDRFSRSIPLAALEEHLRDGEIEEICHDLGHAWRDRQLPPGITVRSCVQRALTPRSLHRTGLGFSGRSGNSRCAHPHRFGLVPGPLPPSPGRRRVTMLKQRLQAAGGDPVLPGHNGRPDRENIT